MIWHLTDRRWGGKETQPVARYDMATVAKNMIAYGQAASPLVDERDIPVAKGLHCLIVSSDHFESECLADEIEFTEFKENPRQWRPFNPQCSRRRLLFLSLFFLAR